MLKELKEVYDLALESFPCDPVRLCLFLKSRIPKLIALTYLVFEYLKKSIIINNVACIYICSSSLLWRLL